MYVCMQVVKVSRIRFFFFVNKSIVNGNIYSYDILHKESVSFPQFSYKYERVPRGMSCQLDRHGVAALSVRPARLSRHQLSIRTVFLTSVRPKISFQTHIRM